MHVCDCCAVVLLCCCAVVLLCCVLYFVQGEALAVMGVAPSASELETLLVELDADGSGTLDFDEFLTALGVTVSPSSPSHGHGHEGGADDEEPEVMGGPKEHAGAVCFARPAACSLSDAQRAAIAGVEDVGEVSE